MARSVVSSAMVVRQKYYWPDMQLNLWTIVMLATAGTILGIFAEFYQIQSTMRQGVPWIIPYGITVGALTIVFIILELILIAQLRLMPAMMILWSFMLFVLYIAGLIETAIQLFGEGGIQSNCQNYVFNNKYTGPYLTTLAWLQQNNICQCWQTAFAFWIIGAVFLVWMMVMANQVRLYRFG